MTRPHVLVHTMTSADGRTDHFAGDVGLFYQLAAGFPQDAVLTGSGTLVAAAAEQGVDLDAEDPPPGPGADDPPGPGADAPLLVLVDSGGRLTRFAWLRAMPYWRDVVVLCAESTPPRHLALLDRHRVEYLVVGTDRVDLAAGLTALATRYGVRRVRVDSGGTLTGALLRAGLVDEVSILLAPYLVGGSSARGLFVAPDLPGGSADGVTRLELSGVEQLRGGVVHLRYRVERDR